MIYTPRPQANPFATAYFPRRFGIERYLSRETLIPIIEQIERSGAKAIVLTVDPSSWKESGKDLKDLLEKLKSYGNISIANSSISKVYQYSDPLFVNSGLLFDLESGSDRTIAPYDQRSRRTLVYYDEDNTFNTNTIWINKYFPQAFDISKFTGFFTVLATRQVYARHWRPFTFGKLRTDSTDFASSISNFSGKIVFLSFSDNWTFYQLPSIYSTFKSELDPILDKTSDAQLHIENLYVLTNRDYIHVPSRLMGYVWNFLFLIPPILCIFLISPLRAFLSTFVTLFALCGLDILIYIFFSFAMPTAQTFVSLLALQYISAPYLFYRFIKVSERKRFQKEAEVVREKEKLRAIAKSAQAEFGLRLATQVAHDIRSPLTAIKVATDFSLNDLKPEASKLLLDASHRLNKIANELLHKFRNGTEGEPEKEIGSDLIATLKNLTQEYQGLFEKICFEFSSSEKQRHVLVPQFLIERTVSNLINNSVEALLTEQTQNPKIEIRFSEDEDNYLLSIQDNGPGIPEEISKKLFQRGVTYGKKNGNGLGLFQVMEFATSVSGAVSYKNLKPGSLFSISIPKNPKKIEMTVHSPIFIVDTDANFASLVKSRFSDHQQIHYFSDPEHVTDYLTRNRIKTGTILSELIFKNSEINGFDILMNPLTQGFERLLYTPLSENTDVISLSKKNQIAVLNKSDLRSIHFKVL